jgi:hypothetical protein
MARWRILRLAPDVLAKAMIARLKQGGEKCSGAR